jgi:acetyl-CoA acyltransferase
MRFPLDVAIASAVRTPVGRAIKGSLRDTRPDDLAARVIDEAIRRAPGLSPERVDDVVLGCAFPEAAQGLNIARNAVFLAGWPASVPGQTVNRLCASSLQAIALAAQAIETGSIEVAVAGGVESMSTLNLGTTLDALNPQLKERAPGACRPMPLTAERMIERFAITRESQDEYAYASQQKAARAQSADRFREELFPVATKRIVGGEAREVLLRADECVRADFTYETLRQLKPAFLASGTITEGNSCPLSDGAAAVTLVSRGQERALGAPVLGRIRAFALAGVDPDLTGTGPVHAIRALLERAELPIEAIDLFEINEAFAGQSIYCRGALGIPDERLNVNGGGIALGHPLGATGAKLTATILFELRRRRARFGIVALCAGGGMGAAALFESTSARSPGGESS